MKHDAAVQTTTITGLHYHKSNDIHWLFACDTARCNVYDEGTEAMVDISGGSDIFTGLASDLFWFLTFDGYTYLCNGEDSPYKISGANCDIDGSYTIESFNTDLNDSGSRVMTSYKQLYHLNDRLLAYDIAENTTRKRYRLRYSQPLVRGNTPVFTDDYYLDVPTDDIPVTGRRLGRYIYLWHDESLWMIRPTGDTDLPFKPDLIRGDQGSRSHHVCVPFEKGFLTVGNKDLIHFDGYESRPLNLPNLNNVLALFEWDAIKYSWGVHDKHRKKIYITFAASGSTYPDRILEYSLTEKMFAVHAMNAHTMTMYPQFGGAPGWDDAPAAYGLDPATATLDDMPISGADYTFGLDYPIPVYGGRDGKLYRMFLGTDEAGSNYGFTAKTARFNPFTNKEQRVALGRIAFLVDTSATASFTASLYKNTGDTAYKTQVITCTGSGDKHWESMHAGGEIGDFHRIGFSNTTKDNSPAIHAMWLEMEPAGYLDP